MLSFETLVLAYSNTAYEFIFETFISSPDPKAAVATPDIENVVSWIVVLNDAVDTTPDVAVALVNSGVWVVVASTFK